MRLLLLDDTIHSRFTEVRDVSRRARFPCLHRCWRNPLLLPYPVRPAAIKLEKFVTARL